MSSYFGISNGSFFDNFFGSTNSSSGTGSLSIGDYSMIKNGSYKKLLTKYYKENGTDADATNAISNTAAADSTKKLLVVKDSASAVKDAAATMTDMSTDEASREKLLKEAKGFVTNYNSLVDGMDDIESVSILQNAIWLTNQTKANDDLLKKVGITITAKNDLALDEDTFKKASEADVKAVFNGKGSVVGQIANRASQLYTLAGTQAIVNSKMGSYNSNGSYATISTSKLYNSLL